MLLYGLSADSADNEFWARRQKWTLKTFYETVLKQTNKKYSEIAHKTD